MRRLIIVALIVLAAVAAPRGNAQIINTLRGFEDSLGWQGAILALGTGHTGNSEYVEFDFGAAIQYETARNRFRLLLDRTYRTASGDDVADNSLAHLRHNYSLGGRFATVEFVQAQRDPFRRIESRYLLGAGLRVDIVEKKHFDFFGGLTPMVEWNDISDDDTPVEATGRMSFFASALGKPKDHVSVDATAFYQPRLRDFDDARAFGTAGVQVDVVGGVYFTFTYIIQYDSRPAPGVETTDQKIGSGVGWKF